MTDQVRDRGFCRVDGGHTLFRPSRFHRLSILLLMMALTQIVIPATKANNSTPQEEASEFYNIVYGTNRLAGTTDPSFLSGDQKEADQSAPISPGIIDDGSPQNKREYKQQVLDTIPKQSETEYSDLYRHWKRCKSDKKSKYSKSDNGYPIQVLPVYPSASPSECTDDAPSVDLVDPTLSPVALFPPNPSPIAEAPVEANPSPNAQSPVEASPPIPNTPVPQPTEIPTTPPNPAGIVPVSDPTEAPAAATQPDLQPTEVPTTPPNLPEVVETEKPSSEGQPPSPATDVPGETPSNPTNPPMPVPDPTEAPAATTQPDVQPTEVPSTPPNLPEAVETEKPSSKDITASPSMGDNLEENPSTPSDPPQPGAQPTELPTAENQPFLQPTEVPSTPPNLPEAVETEKPSSKDGSDPTQPIAQPTELPTAENQPFLQPTEIPIITLQPSPEGTEIPTVTPEEPTATEMPVITLQPKSCQNIEQQSPPGNVDSTLSPTIFSFLASVQYNTSSVSTQDVQGYLGSMNVPIALWVASCEVEAMGYVTSDSKKRFIRRELQETGTVEYSEVEPWGKEEVCVSASPGLTCETFRSRINIYVNGTILEGVLQTRLFEALTIFDPLVTDQIGVESMDVDKNDIQLVDEGDENNIEGEENELSSQTSTVAIVGIAVAGLMLVCLIAYRCWNCHTRGTLAHFKLDEDDEMNRAITIEEFASSDSDGNQGWETRVVLLDEKSDQDEFQSDPNPYSDEYEPEMVYPEGMDYFSDTDMYWLNHPSYSSALHECSAATCMICEARRQRGVRKAVVESIHASSPARPTHVPTSLSSRWYLESDTVEL